MCICVSVFLYLCVCIWVFSHRNAPQCALFNPNVQWVQCVGLIPGSAGIAPINTVNKYNWQEFWHFWQFLQNHYNWIVNINNITATRDVLWTRESFRQLGPESGLTLLSEDRSDYKADTGEYLQFLRCFLAKCNQLITVWIAPPVHQGGHLHVAARK